MSRRTIGRRYVLGDDLYTADDRRKHLDMVQAVVARMAAASSTTKGGLAATGDHGHIWVFSRAVCLHRGASRNGGCRNLRDSRCALFTTGARLPGSVQGGRLGSRRRLRHERAPLFPQVQRRRRRRTGQELPLALRPQRGGAALRGSGVASSVRAVRRMPRSWLRCVAFALASYRDRHEHVRVWKIQFVFVVLVGLLVIDDQFAAA